MNFTVDKTHLLRAKSILIYRHNTTLPRVIEVKLLIKIVDLNLNMDHHRSLITECKGETKNIRRNDVINFNNQ